MYVGYRRAHSGDFDVAIESTRAAADVTSGLGLLVDATQSLRGSGRRWQMPTEPRDTYTYRVRFVRPCRHGWRVERLAFSVDDVDSFRLTVGRHVVAREVPSSVCHLSGTLSPSPFRTVTRLHYLINLDLEHICSPPSLLPN